MAFNKMFVMLPVMLAARKLDGENPDTVFMLRCAYGTVQAVIVLLVAYIYISSQAVSNGKDKDRLIYVPPPPAVSFSFSERLTTEVLSGLLLFFTTQIYIFFRATMRHRFSCSLHVLPLHRSPLHNSHSPLRTPTPRRSTPRRSSVPTFRLRPCRSSDRLCSASA